MRTKHQAVWIDVPEGLSEKDKMKLADRYIEYIYDRTIDGNKDKSGKRFKGYSKAYIKSHDFKVSGKTPRDVNLKLSGDMMAELKILKIGRNRVQIGYEKRSPENAKADGNIRGTYGTRTPDPKKARDFLGFEGRELKRKEKIDKKYKPDNSKDYVSNISKSLLVEKLKKVSVDKTLQNRSVDRLESLFINRYIKDEIDDN